jgi:hypothetical protein
MSSCNNAPWMREPSRSAPSRVSVRTQPYRHAPVLPDPLDQVPEGEPIASVTADGACDAVEGQGAQAVIPPRRSAEPWKTNSPGAGPRNEALRAVGRLGRPIPGRAREGSGAAGAATGSRAAPRPGWNRTKLPGQKRMARDLDRRARPGPVPGPPSCRPASPSSTATPPSASPSRSPSADPRGRGGVRPSSASSNRAPRMAETRLRIIRQPEIFDRFSMAVGRAHGGPLHSTRRWR